MRIDRHGSKGKTHQHQHQKRHPAHVHHGVGGHVALQPRRVISLPNGRPTVSQLMQHDGNDDRHHHTAKKQLTGRVEKILDKKTRREHA